MALKSQEPRTKSSTALRTFRIPRNLISVLESESKGRGISANALVSSLITRFNDWDRFADRFDFFSLTDDLFKAFLDEIREERIIAIADTMGARIAKDATMFWSKETTVESLVEYLNHRCRYAGYGSMEYEKKDRNHTIILQHKLGYKWSLFLQHTLDQVLRNPVGIVAQIVISETNVVMHFTS